MIMNVMMIIHISYYDAGEDVDDTGDEDEMKMLMILVMKMKMKMLMMWVVKVIPSNH